MKYLLIILLFISCGSRKVATEKQTEKVSEKTEVKAETKSETTSETTHNVTSDFLGFNIEPLNGIPAVFSFNYNGQQITGETTGKLNFSNEKKQEDIKTKVVQVVETVRKTITTYINETTHKTKQSERKPYPWYLLIGAGMLLMIGLQLAWKYVKGYIPFLK